MGDWAPIRFGLIGTGAMAASTGRILTGYHGARVSAISSRTTAGADRLADELEASGAGPISRFDDFRAMLVSGECDAVAVMLPDHMHEEATIAAAEAGVHVLIEKPLALSSDSATRMVASLREAGVLSMCLYTHRWIPAVAQAKALLADLGTPVCAYTRKHDTIDVPTTMLRWADQTTCAWFLSGHDIDMVTWLFDSKVVEVSATARRGLLSGRGIETPDVMVIQARLENGAIATFESGWVYPSTFPTTIDSYLSLVAEGGTIHIDRQKESILVASDESYRYPRNMVDNLVHGVARGSYPFAIEHFVECVRTGQEPYSSIESARDVTAVLEAAHLAEKSGQTVRVTYP